MGGASALDTVGACLLNRLRDCLLAMGSEEQDKFGWTCYLTNKMDREDITGISTVHSFDKSLFGRQVLGTGNLVVRNTD